MSIINFTSAVKNKQRYSNTKVWNKKHNAHSNRDNRTKREIVQFFYDVNPGGQAIQCSTMQPVNLTRLPIYSLAIIVLTTGAGVWIFKKKDLK